MSPVSNDPVPKPNTNKESTVPNIWPDLETTSGLMETREYVRNLDTKTRITRHQQLAEVHDDEVLEKIYATEGELDKTMLYQNKFLGGDGDKIPDDHEIKDLKGETVSVTLKIDSYLKKYGAS